MTYDQVKEKCITFIVQEAVYETSEAYAYVSLYTADGLFSSFFKGVTTVFPLTDAQLLGIYFDALLKVKTLDEPVKVVIECLESEIANLIRVRC